MNLETKNMSICPVSALMSASVILWLVHPLSVLLCGKTNSHISYTTIITMFIQKLKDRGGDWGLNGSRIKFFSISVHVPKLKPQAASVVEGD
jgi:hypothetical protein